MLTNYDPDHDYEDDHLGGWMTPEEQERLIEGLRQDVWMWQVMFWIVASLFLLVCVIHVTTILR